MKWLEIIKVNSPGEGGQIVAGEIRNLLTLSEAGGVQNIRVFQNAATGDKEIHLYWNSGKAQPDGSAIGTCLVHILKELGLTSHSVWIEWEQPGGHRERRTKK